MYAVGSKGSTDLLDARTLHVTVVSLPILDLMLMQIFLLKVVKMISSPSRYRGCGIRSVSFKGNILTIGTGKGIILFWDLRAQRFLEFAMNSDRAVCLKTSKGWLVSYEAHLFIVAGKGKTSFPSLSATWRLVSSEPGRHPAAKVQPSDLHSLLWWVWNSFVCGWGPTHLRSHWKLYRTLSIEDELLWRFTRWPRAATKAC